MGSLLHAALEVVLRFMWVCYECQVQGVQCRPVTLMVLSCALVIYDYYCQLIIGECWPVILMVTVIVGSFGGHIEMYLACCAFEESHD
jgi:hypothetical protein